MSEERLAALLGGLDRCAAAIGAQRVAVRTRAGIGSLLRGAVDGRQQSAEIADESVDGGSGQIGERLILDREESFHELRDTPPSGIGEREHSAPLVFRVGSPL